MKKRWSLTKSSDSLTRDPELAGLILRLGAAVNAIRASQRWTILCVKRRGVAARRDRMWSFLIATAYLKEVIDGLLKPHYEKITQLARQDGTPEKAIKDLGQLMSTKPYALYPRMLLRARNNLVFHWDEEPFRNWAAHYGKKTVIWAEGVGTKDGEVVFSASLDALLDSVIPGATEVEVREGVGEVAEASGLIVGVFQRAIHAYISN